MRATDAIRSLRLIRLVRGPARRVGEWENQGDVGNLQGDVLLNNNEKLSLPRSCSSHSFNIPPHAS